MAQEGRDNPAYTHGHTTGGFSPTYHSWASMIQRCTNPNRRAWKDYGGRGIKVCERWLSFENFLEDMGERPEGKTLDRRDSDGDYEKDNCRWATQEEQYANRRQQRIVTAEYREAIYKLVVQRPHTLPELYEVMGLHPEVVKKEVRKLRASGKIVTSPVPGRRGNSGRGATLLCTAIGGCHALQKQGRP